MVSPPVLVTSSTSSTDQLVVMSPPLFNPSAKSLRSLVVAEIRKQPTKCDDPNGCGISNVNTVSGVVPRFSLVSNTAVIGGVPPTSPAQPWAPPTITPSINCATLKLPWVRSAVAFCSTISAADGTITTVSPIASNSAKRGPLPTTAASNSARNCVPINDATAISARSSPKYGFADGR